MSDKSDTFVVLCITCLALAGFWIGPVAGFLALALGFAFFALAAHGPSSKRDDG